MRTTKYLLLLSILFTIGSAKAQENINYADLLGFYHYDYDSNLVEITDGISYQSELDEIILDIKKHGKYDKFINEELVIRVTLGRGISAIVQKRFIGLNSFKNSNYLKEMNEITASGDRILFEFAKSKKNSFKILMVSPLDQTGINYIFNKAKKMALFIDETTIFLNAGATAQVKDKDSISSEFIDGRFVYSNRIKLRNISFVQSKGRMPIIANYQFDDFSIQECKGLKVAFENCVFEQLFLEEIAGTSLVFRNCRFKEIVLEGKQLEHLSFQNCVFDSVPFNMKQKRIDLKVLKGSFGSIEITNNIFRNANESFPIMFQFESKVFDLLDNQFQETLILDKSAIFQELQIRGNSFNKYLSFEKMIFPESNSDIDWTQLSGQKLAVSIAAEDSSKVIGLDLFTYFSSPENKFAFNQLVKSYQKLFSLYRHNGDLESANACYAEKKDLEKQRLAWIYRTEGGFKNWITWRLNSLMKLYTEHATDPSKAIIISIWIILGFAVFYFFFPSDWDTSSKSELLNNFKLFITKNEHGYFKPFVTLLLGFLVSFSNAFILSLNAFVTLGFGNIPARGLARYVTIIQGFMGWFLLSIFTVALINQVLV